MRSRRNLFFFPLLLSALAALLIVPSGAFGAIAPKLGEGRLDNLSGNNITLSDEALGLMKSALAAGLDKKISRLESFAAKAEAAPIDSEDMALISSYVDKIIAGLEAYKARVLEAETAEELVIIRREANQYIVEHQDEIKEAARVLSAALSDEMAAMLEKALEKLNTALAQLEESCPEGSDEIAELYKLVAELEKALEAYKANPEAGKAYLAKMLSDIDYIVRSIEVLLEKCGETIKKSIDEAGNSTVVMKISTGCDAGIYAGEDPLAYVEHDNYTFVVAVVEDPSGLEGDPCVTVLNKASAKEEMEENREQMKAHVQEKLKELGINRTLDDILEKDKLEDYLDEMNKDYQDFVTPSAVSGHASGDAQEIYSEAVGWIWVSDAYLHRVPEKWLLPVEFIEETPGYPNSPAPGEMVSDCSEQANTLVSLLIASGGYSEETARVALGLVNFGGSEGGHAWAEVYEDGGWMALEATSGSYYDEKKDTVVYSEGLPFDYFRYNEFPVVETWYLYNSKYIVDAGTGQGNAPSSW